jgi:hypothetical protein
VGSESAAAAAEAWQLALRQLSAAPRGPQEHGVEVARHPLTGAVLVRRWRGVEGGAVAALEPAGAPPFPLLVAEPEFPMAPGAAPPPLRPLARYDWLAQPDAGYAAARARVRGTLGSAWYSCSPAFSDGRRGVWHLVSDAPGE